jgi:hypothetical protein
VAPHRYLYNTSEIPLWYLSETSDRYLWDISELATYIRQVCCNLMQSDAERCRAMQSDAERCRAMQSDAERCRAMQSDAVAKNRLSEGFGKLLPISSLNQLTTTTYLNVLRKYFP